MDGIHCTFSASHQPGNPVGVASETFNVPSFSPQLSGSVFFSFPPPPCAPSPATTQRIATNMAPQSVNIQTHPGSANTAPECQAAVSVQQQATGTDQELVRENNEVTEITDGFSKGLNLNPNEPQCTEIDCTSRPASVVDYSGPAPYSMILPQASFVQPFGGNVPAPPYHQFSPVLPVSMSQVHPMYPINVISTQDPMGPSPGYIPMRPTSASDCHIQQTVDVNNQPWSNQPMMPPNPPMYWSHYVATDKAHGMALASQQFMRRHSIVDDSAVVTPTNVCPPCNLAGIVSATPEFIHPRKPDVPQWLMSPPVGEQDPSIISYAPMLYHNVRIPSVTGIAIPVVGPVGAAVPVSNHGMNTAEPPRVDSSTFVFSPAPCYEVSSAQSAVGCLEMQQTQDKTSGQSLTIVSASSEQPFLLTSLSDFPSTTSKNLLSPTDFDSAYDSSVISSPKPQPETLTEFNAKALTAAFQNDESCMTTAQEKLESLIKKRNIDSAIIENLKRASERFSETSKEIPKDIANDPPKGKTSHNIKMAAASTQTSKMSHNEQKTKNASLLYSYLLSAAVNLSAASNILLCKQVSCTKHHCSLNKRVIFRKRCSFGARCGCVKKHPAVFSSCKPAVNMQQQTQCWQCAGEPMPDIKQPTPDLFNRWPNIPPPPPPIPEEEDDRSVCSAPEMCHDVLPLAAALFRNEPIDCCQGNNVQDETPSSYPIGVFWDIENCAVPTGKSSLSIVQRVRERFFAGHKEAEFMCVCDINKETRHVIQDLNNAQVNVVHINATAKNAADDKLRQSIRRFAHNHPAPATLVLITGDSNFTSEVSDLRHRHKYFVVLIHPAHANQALKQAATTVICYEQLVSDLPIVHVSPKSTTDSPNPQLLVSNLPLNNDANAVRSRLRQLSENCGGKVVKLSMGTAILKFATAEAANRALKRLEGEDVYGHSIKVTVMKQSPVRNGRNLTNTPNFSPGRNSGPFNRQKARGEPMQNTFIPAGCENSRQVMNIRQGFPPPFPHAPLPMVGLPPFTTHPAMPPPIPGFNPSPNMPQAGYSSMPPPPQPQHFQPSPQALRDYQEGAVKLTISNIDSQLGLNTIQDVILKQISGICQILDMKVRPHNRFTVVCDVSVPRVQDASRVLQHLQRQKIGTKRVLVTLAQQNCEEFGFDEAACLKRDCFSVLKEAPDKRMPLYRFFNLYIRRFKYKIKLDELRQIPDVILFHDGPSGREIYLNPNVQDEQSLEQHLANYPRSGRSTPDINHDFLLPVCKLHYPTDAPRPPPSEKGSSLLKIEMGLREFSAKLHALLHSHNGILQLDGFEYCYCAEYGTFPFPKDVEGGGVIVEHQASYVPGVQIITSQPHCLGVKAIVWSQPQSDTGSDTASDTSGASRWKSPNLIHFSREVVDLLKDRPYCCLPYDNFGSVYQLHFGHACRPSDYGFTRISELLAAIPHVLQIMGSLSDRILTLTHRAQVKRFTQEVVKILKSTPDRAILVAQMPELYNGTFNRVWRLRDYGVSVLSDLLDDIPEGHICTTGEGDNIVLSLPIRERSADEKERTNQFGREVVKILRGRPHYRMPFTDFVPAYHRQFGRQCKLANYGFSKLIDLFEALPHVVQIIERGTEKCLALTSVEQQKILSIQITSILRAQIQPTMPLISVHSMDPMHKNNPDGPTLPLACIPALFQQKYGFPLIPQELNSSDLDDLIGKLAHAIKVVVNKSGDKMIRLAERKPLRLLSAQLLALLLDQTADQLDIEQFHMMYNERYKESLEPNEYGFLSFSDIIRKALPGVVKMDLDAPECLIHLKPLYKEARAIRSVLLKNNGTMTMGEFNFAYLTTFHRPVDCEKLGFPTFESLLRALPNVLIVKGFGAKRTLTLRNHMQFGPLTAASMAEKNSGNMVHGSASLDDLQTLEASRPPQSAWMPKVCPPCMVPYWNGGRQTGPLNNSASMGDFRNGDNDRRNQPGPVVGRPAPNWIPPKKSMIPPRPTSSAFHVPKSRTQQSKLPPGKVQAISTPPTTCTFTIGEVMGPSACSRAQDDQTPARRGVSMSIITMPNGSTPIASTSSCSSSSTPKSNRYSRSSDEYSDDSCSSDENCQSHKTFRGGFSSVQKPGVSSLPNSPFARISATAFVGSISSMRNGHAASEHSSPGRIKLAASFPTLTQT